MSTGLLGPPMISIVELKILESMKREEEEREKMKVIKILSLVSTNLAI